jgi:electron transfer flavoprotein alpha subunit
VDEILYADHPQLADYSWDAYMNVFADILAEKQPRVALFGDTSIGSEVAGGLSARLQLPMVSYCLRIAVEDGQLRYTSKIYGGKIFAEGWLPADTTLVMMLPGSFKVEEGQSDSQAVVTPFTVPGLDDGRIKTKQYIEPETGDVDISKETILIGVGRGIQREDNLELVQEMAEALGGVVCATRPVIDQNWLSTSRLVGKSGKTIKPKVYLAAGISGAPEHTEAITDSEIIIAINTDPAAPIFDLATYGIQQDLNDIIPAITEKVRELR